MTFIYGVLSQKHYRDAERVTFHFFLSLFLSHFLHHHHSTFIFTNNLQDYGMDVNNGVWNDKTHSVCRILYLLFRFCVRSHFWWTTYVKLFSAKIIIIVSPEWKFVMHTRNGMDLQKKNKRKKKKKKKCCTRDFIYVHRVLNLKGQTLNGAHICMPYQQNLSY